MIKPGLLALLCCSFLFSIGQENEIQNLYAEASKLFKEGKKENALGRYEKIYQLDPRQALALEWMIHIYYELDQPAKAAQSGSKLCVLKPDNSKFQSSTCYYFTLSGQPDLAESYGKKAVELNSYDYNNMLNLGHTYLLRKRNEEAIYWYLKALQWVPSKSIFEESIFGDFSYLSGLKLITPKIAQEFKDGLALEFASIQPENNYLLDSILTYHQRKTNRDEKEKVINWKKEFVTTEAKKEVVRYNVLAKFLTDIGMSEFNKRNRSVAMDIYFLTAERMYQNDADSLGLAKFFMYISKELLTIRRSEQKSSKNSAALSYAIDARNIIEKYNLRELEIPSLIQLSACYFQNKEALKGKNTFRQLMYWSDKNKDSTGMAFSCNGLASFFQETSSFDSALHYNEKGLTYITPNKNPDNIRYKLEYRQVELLHETGKTKESLALAITLPSKMQESLIPQKEHSDLYELIGLICFEIGMNDYAKVYLDSAISTYFDFSDYEEAKKNERSPEPISNARGQSIKIMAYLAAKSDEPKPLFFWMEIMKDNFLKKAIGSELADPPFVLNFDKMQNTLPENTACISYAGTAGNLSLGIGFNDKSQKIKILDDDFLLSVFRNSKLPGTTSAVLGLLDSIKQTSRDSILILKTLPTMQYYYLSNRDPKNIRGIGIKPKENVAKGLSEETIRLSKLMYNMYVQPFESEIKDKKKLIICPDFILQIFPFEALVMPDGRFMGEVYDISYTPGFTISHYMDMRSYTTENNLIAFGNPDYSSYHPEKLSGRALDFSYLGVTSWNDLPGTEKELSAIKLQNKMIDIMTGANISETTLKEMSIQGKLKKASVMHFALHGIAGPASSKEDNSLVITEPDGGKEDGLLQFSEAIDLDIKAQLVCLSACETGINQIEDDGSMVTMATAFLAAGARSVLATNWSIDDAATAIFIKDVYTQVQDQKISFSEAVAKTKRRFIKGDFGDKYKKPFYWAPFKYYGN